MADNTKNNVFWTSYADLMTSLFFVMLVLYAITFVILKREQDKYRVKARELDKIREIQKAVREIDTTGKYFVYDSTYRKHVLNIDIQFPTGQADINAISYGQRIDLKNAGERIVNLITNFNRKKESIKYLVIVEGQASRDGAERNYRLSHERALALISFWRDAGIRLGSLENCELIIAGSGEYGVPRKQPDVPPNNQRFLIHIIPKVGNI